MISRQRLKEVTFQRKTVEGISFILVFFAVFGYMSHRMGLSNMLNTIMNTAHDLLLNTVFYLMGVVVLSGALSKLLNEFGVVRILQFLFGGFMKPLVRLPGISVLGALMSFLSDNPAVLTLAQDSSFSRFFRKYQLISFINFGTAFGMGLIVVMFMLGKGFATEPLVGVVGAMLASCITTIGMQRYLLHVDPSLDQMMPDPQANVEPRTHEEAAQQLREHKESVFIRFLNAILDGGKTGVDLGLAIIPGVIIISTAVFMFTFGAGEGGVYTGEAYQGVELLPRLAGKVGFLFDWLFGIKDPELMAFPITSLGAVGAALGQIPRFLEEGLLEGSNGANAIAVFTAMGISWSGFFSTYSAIFDAMGWRKWTSSAMIIHLLCGLLAGILAHWLYVAVSLFG